MRKGDAIAAVAHPIAVAVDFASAAILPAAWQTDLQNCGGCQRMQQNLNEGMSLWGAIHERFFVVEEGSTMQYIILKQILIEDANSPEEAMTKLEKGRTVSIQIQERVVGPVVAAPTPMPATGGRIAKAGQ